MSFPTPSLSHLSRADYAQVYEPSTDTFLFLDALEQERATLLALRPAVCVEIGPGSGCILSFLSALLDVPAFMLGIDINPSACRATLRTLAANKAHAADVVVGDLCCGFEAARGPLAHKVDVLLFNPPYVPTDMCELQGTGIERAWAGGPDGRVVVDKLLPLVKDLMSDKGIFYLLALRENKPDQIASLMKEEGFSASIVLKRATGGENLCIMKFTRAH
mmetsp:Transcript_26811/g.67405  ORF Transcript_26811/g.67405 Transcript_26811/m.67405 type:complete len:219 (+) Transcript_26811:143-799(+)|eukprot:CAMPEP_0177632056 /NCGR_PEP_ID=MMETSP0447-20121125/2083_1 /TAXON_ID=0 /ORGANISM="Stygamoeba regulata, Strain BSH-02190019" /LENGTH=218 /DNA_ID=CAMNT_0019133589 /DNA_START=54 /DNA_END=710 /DNA_ORIENTATION=+